jgi:hypothetical protein
MSKIQVNDDSNVLDVEILPSKNEKTFWILWSVIGISIGGYGLYEFGAPKLRTLPLWLIFLVFSQFLF